MDAKSGYQPKLNHLQGQARIPIKIYSEFWVIFHNVSLGLDQATILKCLWTNSQLTKSHVICIKVLSSYPY